MTPPSISPAAQAPTAGVIGRKIAVPALPHRFVERPRLERLLAELVARKRVVIVTASAGSGKTTAVVGVSRGLAGAVAWLTVDRSDAAPGRLVTYLEAALGLVRPHVIGTGTGALTARLPHAEAAGLLAEAIGAAPTTLVLDELERLGNSPEAWAVIEALLRYAPEETSLVLISRRDVPTALCALPSPQDVAVVGDAEVAFTADEAGRALARVGKHDIDARAAVRSTAGWVTGVLFEAWRSAEHVTGQGGETDPLYDYLASQILGQLSDEERAFLVDTSLFDEVTVSRAEALGWTEAERLLRSLRPVHLPATWDAERRSVRCHSYFREYLLACLERRGEDAVRALRVGYARRLVDEGQDEEAVEELFRAGAAEAAMAPAARTIVAIVERFDLQVAERWLAALAQVGGRPSWPLVTAELMIAIAEDQVERGERIADRLAAQGLREEYARSSERAGWLMAWCYLHTARATDIEQVLAASPPGPSADAVRYAMQALTDVSSGDPPVAPPVQGGPLDALIFIADYCLGRLAELSEVPESPWVEAVKLPWRIAALRALGHTERALALLERARTSDVAGTTLLVCAAGELLIDAGTRDEAKRAIDEGRRRASAAGSLAFQGLSRLVEAKLALRIDRDPACAEAVLDDPICRRAAEAFRFFGELADTWRGLTRLQQDHDADAVGHLRRAVESMVRGDRILELPSAAVYLAEGLWRTGDDSGADQAADLALDAARRQGSNHLLLQALADVPGVASRRIDAEPAGDSSWRELGRALIVQGALPPAAVTARVLLHEFGRRALMVDGDEVRPRIAKSYELLAYLATRPNRRADRDGLLDVLFDGRRDGSSRAYLRQAIHWLRQVLPEGAVAVEDGVVRLGDGIAIATESLRFEHRLAEAARLRGGVRLRVTMEALEAYDQGPYLPGQRAMWADDREAQLAEQATEARYQAALLVFGAARYDDARRLVDQVLASDPLREAAWRLSMRMAHALGDEDAVIRAFHDCEVALGHLDALPSQETRLLLKRLRR